MPGRSRTVTATAPPLIPGTKLPPPPELSPAQALVWDRIIAPLPVGWISAENAHLLKELCRHAVYADNLCREIEAARASPDAKPATVLALMRAHVLQSRCMATLATKLRLTKASRYVRDAEAAAIASRNSPAGAVMPWNDWPGGQQ
jgi:hypothetical protein